MQFRFTIFDPTVAPTGIEIPQPVGWKDTAIVLERHEKYHSLVEYFEGDFIFFGSGLSMLQEIETNNGPDARPRILIEISVTISVWETVFDGLLDLSLLEEFSYGRKMYKLKTPIIRNDFWSKFINRESIPVNVIGTVDLDGGTRIAPSSFTLPMPSQKIVNKFRSEMYPDGVQVDNFIVFEFDRTGDNEIRTGVVELPIVKSDNLKERYTYSNGATESISAFIPNFEFISALYSGSYAIDIQLVLSTSPYVTPFALGNQVTNVKCYIRKNQETPIEFTKTQLGINGTSGRSVYTYFATWELVKGDKISMYFYYTGSSAEDYYIVFNGIFEDSYIEVTASTIFEDTETECIKLENAIEGVLSKLVGDDSVVESTYLGACGGKYGLAKGIHVRGKSFDDKTLTISWNDMWAGINPCLNLGLGYTSDDKFVIEQKSYFYNLTTSLNLSNVANIIRSYDLTKYYRSITIGYEKGQSESDGGLDDPQTKATWTTRFATIGKDEILLSKFIAASLAIEETRRQRVEAGNDWRLDEEIFLMALDADDELENGLDFDSVTGLLNSDTRINIRLSCARNFERWRSWFNGCMQHDLDQQYHFASGEGNREMISEVGVGDCDYGENPTIGENQDFDVTDSYTLIPKKYAFKAPFTWTQYKTIRDNPENAIGLSRNTESHTPHFINKLKFYLVKGFADFEVWQATVPTEENGFRLLEDGNYRLLEDGERRLLN